MVCNRLIFFPGPENLPCWSVWYRTKYVFDFLGITYFVCKTREWNKKLHNKESQLKTLMGRYYDSWALTMTHGPTITHGPKNHTKRVPLWGWDVTPLRARSRAGQGKFSFLTPRTKTPISADSRPPPIWNLEVLCVIKFCVLAYLN